MSKHFFKNLRIGNFRGIKSLEINDLARVNLFVGKNNCGKTSVLEAAFLLSGMSNANLIVTMQNHRGVTITEGSDIKDFFYNRDHENGSILSCAQTTGGRNLKILPLYGNLQVGQAGVVISKVPGNGDAKYASEFSMGTPVTGQSLIGFGYEFSVSGQADESDVHRAGTHLTERGGKNFVAFTDSGYKEPMRGAGVYLSRRGYNCDSVDQMLNKKRKELLLSALQSIDPKVVDIKTGSHDLVSVDVGFPDSFIPINLLGDGIMRILSILSGIDGASDGMLFLDEIENGLHVTALERVWEVILNHSAKSNAQIFLTTHSGDAIESLRNALGEKLFPDVVACYRLVKYSTDEVRAYRYSADQLQMALASETDIRL
ncbi:MAG: AAA family ATPase [Gammaproteobacteria bacterium]|nr:AAA family ATPase [Gammaproteobacteria bacterium]